MEKVKHPANSISLNDAQSEMQGKVMWILLGDTLYCFKVVRVAEIIEGTDCFLEIKRGFNDKERIYGFIEYNQRVLPVFFPDSHSLNKSQGYLKPCFVVIIDAVTDGMRSQIGLMVNSLDDLLNSSMNEIDNRVIRGRI